MQVFASKKVYMFFYGVIGIINVRPFRNKKMTLLTYSQKDCCIVSASKAYGRSHGTRTCNMMHVLVPCEIHKEVFAKLKEHLICSRGCSTLIFQPCCRPWRKSLGSSRRKRWGDHCGGRIMEDDLCTCRPISCLEMKLLRFSSSSSFQSQSR